ncbi:GGDEF domain-containing protein [Curvibacter sp. RS43]|uniref:GGDEF domain-containing protein n=1 Tax=Curvibacter microcysteis TaxID=3026419 RepID=UPI002361EC04|nr:GGDEF domain-containing protein [Curvibacter sp. RS43]MDD0808761.1 GGDEF domain-containing protein [Curvibacter sp. RS43]
MKPGSIAFRLSLLLAAFSVFAAALASHYTFVTSRGLLRERAEHYLMTTTEVLGRHLQASLQSVSRDTVALAALAAAQGALEPGAAAAPARQALAQAFMAEMESHPDYLQIRLIGASAHGLERVRVQRQPTGLLRVADDDLQEKGHFPYVYEALPLPAGQVYMSELAASRDDALIGGSAMPSYTLSAPVVTAGVVQGVLVVQVAARPFLHGVSADLPDGFQLYMSNRWGDWLVHPDASQTFGFDRGQRVYIQDSFPDAARLLSGQAQQLVTSVRDGTGESVVAAFVRLPIGSEQEPRFWILGLAQPLSAIEGEASVLGRSIVQVLLLLCVAALVLAVLVSRVVTEPLKALAQATRVLGTGQRVQTLPTERTDEIGELARSFRLMEEQVWQQMTQLRTSHHAMDHLAHHDPLTGLPNRRMVEARLEQALHRTAQSQRPCAVLFVDLDHFKNINDGLGHDVGDAVLRGVAQRLGQTLRAGDTVGRLGGDEFVVVCQDLAGEDDATQLALKLKAQFEQPVLVEGMPVQVQASIGIAMAPRDGTEVRALLARADVGMYRAKQNGRNTYSFS